MTRFCAQWFVYIIHVAAVVCVQVEMIGEVSFDLKEPPLVQQRAVNEVNGSELPPLNPRLVTVAAKLECLYQYPDFEQFNAMLSNMMNELTKVLMRSHELIVVEEGDARRRESRFSIIKDRGSDFFEDIYFNMTREYAEFYNQTTQRKARAEEDPCTQQDELKELWRSLIESSLNSLRRAALRCVDEYLRTKNKADDERIRYKVGQFLLKELGKVRVAQLHILCDNFQLCFNDLL